VNVTISRTEWASALQEFTRRNAGRRTGLEEDNEWFGAQAQESGLLLRGLSFDPRKNEVEIMLEDVEASIHFTRMIPGVTAIDIEHLSRGDAAIRIAHGENQTLLRLTDV